MRVLIALLCCLCSSGLMAQEVALFGREGKAVAYIAADVDRTIYLWGGEPVAYLAASAGDFEIRGFNGQHLGWLVNGTVYDGNGEAVGVTKRAATFFTEWEPYKPFKKAKPLKGLLRYQLYKPYWRTSWSDTPLDELLRRGISD
ncbi:4-fold beta flower protein [Flaviaesturariibacter amylovorans]